MCMEGRRVVRVRLLVVSRLLRLLLEAVRCQRRV